MEIRVVVVEPVYQINLGYIARISKNFGVKSLVLVNPKCRYNGKNAIKYSKHARDLIDNARICGTLDDAIKGTLAVGTTATWHKTNASLYNVYSAEKISGVLANNRIKRISVVLGRETTGLTREELRLCPASVSIQTPGSYNVLNISHALAIMLYELSKGSKKSTVMPELYADRKDVDGLLRLFRINLEKRSNIRSRDMVYRAFEHVLTRSKPTKKELSAIAIALSDKKREKGLRKK